jgi:hypothetical protein
MDDSVSTSDQRKVCFLSSGKSATRITADVRSVLQDLDVSVHSSDDLAPGGDVGPALIDAVLSADFVCVVLATRRPPLAVMYEAGVAAGSFRPLVVVADSEVADELPAQLISAPIIRYRPAAKQILRENLHAYVQQVQPIAAQLTLNWPSLFQATLDVRTGEITFDESNLSGRVAARLANAGALVASEPELPGGSRPDVAATFPTLGSEFNPILVEVKSSSPIDSEADIRQVRRFLQAAKARLGIIVYGQSNRKPITKTYGSSGILLLSLDDLLRWDNERLLDEITKLRNRVVHSVW